MQILSLTIHNFRSIADATFAVGDYSLLIGANNSGKSNIVDALRVFYEHKLSFDKARDFPRFATEDNESWIEITFKLTEEEQASLKDEYRTDNNQLVVRKYLLTNSN